MEFSWSGIWEKDVKRHENADWIQKVAEEMQRNKQQNIEIIQTKIKQRICKMAHWKASGPDGVHGYWAKMFVSMQKRIEFDLQSCITRSKVPVWIATFLPIKMCRTKTKIKQNTYNSAPAAILCDDGGK